MTKAQKVKAEFDALVSVGLLTETANWPNIAIRCESCNATWTRSRREDGRAATLQDRNAAVSHFINTHGAALEAAAVLHSALGVVIDRKDGDWAV